MNDTFHTLWWEDDAISLIDQQLLPGQEVVARCESLDAIVRAIKTMQVRGAPAIGCTAAYGMALVAQRSSGTTSAAIIDELARAKLQLDAARPTAVNLAWATGRMLLVARNHAADDLATFK